MADLSLTYDAAALAAGGTPATRPGAGRPTREQARLRHEELLDRALEMFLARGFELSTIEAIAAAVGMTKRTVYARYPDKAALFRAAVQRAIDRSHLPLATLRAAETDDLEETLTAIARIRTRNATTDIGLRLQRIVNAEAYRFPDIHRLAFDQAARPYARYIVDLLARHIDAGAIAAHDPELLGTAFLSLVGGAIRSMVLGAVLSDAEIEARIRFNVRLFLNGVRPR